MRGAIFVDYVRLIRQWKGVDWARVLRLEDFALVQQRIDLAAWYPMANFERLGLAIFSQPRTPGLRGARRLGAIEALAFAKKQPQLLAHGDAVETLMRLRVLRSTLFDFEAFDLASLGEGQAVVELAYHMSPRAEEAACHQTIGFCEAVLDAAGAQKINIGFTECRWAGAERTTATLAWQG